MLYENTAQNYSYCFFRLLSISDGLTTNLFYKIFFLFLLWGKKISVYSVLGDKQFSLVQ